MSNDVLSDKELKKDKANRVMEGVNVWASFYRANPHRFARDYLGLKLKKFQQIILCMMFRFTNSIYLASRGGGKSFLIAIFCVCYCILYPGTTVCVASGTRGQSTEIIEKIEHILIPNSPNLDMEIADIFSGQYQVYYGVHEDEAHLHIHYAINAVSYVDGKKWHKSRKEIEKLEAQMRERAKEVLRR